MSSSVSSSDYAAWRALIDSLAGQIPAGELARLRAEIDKAETSSRPVDPDMVEKFREAASTLAGMTPAAAPVKADRFGKTAPSASGVSADHTVYSLAHPTVEGHVSIRAAGEKGLPALSADIWLLNFSGVFVAIHKKEGLGSKECDWAIVFPGLAERVKNLTAGERRVNDKNDYYGILDAIGRASIGNEVNKDHPLYYPVRDNFTLTLARRPGVPLKEFIGETELHLLDDRSLFDRVGARLPEDHQITVAPWSERRFPFAALDPGAGVSSSLTPKGSLVGTDLRFLPGVGGIPAVPPDPLWESPALPSPPMSLSNPEPLLSLTFRDGEGKITEYRFLDLEGILIVMVSVEGVDEKPEVTLIDRDTAGPFWERFRGWVELRENGVIGSPGYRDILDEALKLHRVDLGKENIKTIWEGEKFSLFFGGGKNSALLAGWAGDNESRSLILTSPVVSGILVDRASEYKFALVRFGSYSFLVESKSGGGKAEPHPISPGLLPPGFEEMFPPPGEIRDLKDNGEFRPEPGWRRAYLQIVASAEKCRVRRDDFYSDDIFEYRIGGREFLVNVGPFKKTGRWGDILLNIPDGIRSAPFLGVSTEDRKIIRTESDARVLAETKVPILGHETAYPDDAYLYVVALSGMTFLFVRRAGHNEVTQLYLITPEVREEFAERIRRAERTPKSGVSLQEFLERLMRRREITGLDLYPTGWSQEVNFTGSHFSLILPPARAGETFMRYLSRWRLVFFESPQSTPTDFMHRYGLTLETPVPEQTHPLIRLSAAPHGRLYQAGSLIAFYDAGEQVLLFYHRRDSGEIINRLKEAKKAGGSFRFSVNKEGVLKDETGWTATAVFARKFNSPHPPLSLRGGERGSYPQFLFDALPEAKIKRTVIPHPGEAPPDVAEITWPLNGDLERIAGIPSEEVYPMIPVGEIGIKPVETNGRLLYVAGPEPGPYLIEELPGNGNSRRFLIKTWQKRNGRPAAEQELLFFFPLSPHDNRFHPLATQHSSLVEEELSRLEPKTEKRRNFERQRQLDAGRTRIVAGPDGRGGVLYVTPTQSLLEYFGLIEPPPERQKVELVSGIVADPEIRRVEQLVAPLSDTPLTVTIKEKTGYPPAESWIPLADKASGEPSSYRLRLPVADPSTLNGGRVAVADEDRIIEYQLQRRKRGGFDLLLDGEKAGRLDVTGETLMLEIGTHFKIQGRLPKVTTVDSVVASGPVGKAALDILLAPLRGEVPIPIVYQEQEVDRTKPPEEDDWSWHDPVTREVSFERKGDFALSGAVDSKGAEAHLDRLTLEWRGQVFTLLRPPVADFGGQAFNKSEFPAWLWGEIDPATGEWVDYDTHVISLGRVQVGEGEIPITRNFTVTLTRKGITNATWVEHRTYATPTGEKISLDLRLQPEGNSPQPPLKLRGGDGGVMSSRIKIEKASWNHIVLEGLLKPDKETVAWGDTVDLTWEDNSRGYLERRHYRLTINKNHGGDDISKNQTKTQLPFGEERRNIRVMWEEEGDKIRLYAVDHCSEKGVRPLLLRSELVPSDFSLEFLVHSRVEPFGPVESRVTVTHGPDGFQIQSNLKSGSDEKGLRWIGHETDDGFVVQHLIGRGGKVSGVRLIEGKPQDIRIATGVGAEEYRLVLKGGEITVTPIGLAGAPDGYELLDDRLVGEWRPKESHSASLPSVSSVEHFEQMADMASAVGNLDPNAFFVPDDASLREMMRIAEEGAELPDEQRTAKLKFVSIGSGLRFEAPFIYDVEGGFWRVFRVNGETDGLFRWNDSPFAVVTRVHLAPNGETELLPIPPGTTRLRSVTVPGKAGIPIFINATGFAGRELQACREAAIRGFLDYLSVIGTGIPEEEENRFSVVRRWEAGDDGMTATVTLGSASDGRTLSFTAVHDPDDGSFYFNGGRTELTVADTSDGITASGLFQGFYHPQTDSYLFLEITPSGSRSPIAFKAVFLPGADPIFVPVSADGPALKPLESRQWFNDGLVQKPEKPDRGGKGPKKGEGVADGQTISALTPLRAVVLPEKLPLAHRDLSPYLVNERDWENLTTVTESDIGSDFEKHQWLHQTLTGWLSDMGGDFQLLPESIAEFRAAQTELRSKIPPNPPFSIPPVRLWLMNANGVRLQVELVPHSAKKGQRPLWVFHPQGTTNQKANLRLVGVDPKRPDRMIQFFIPAFYKRSGADQTLSIYDPSLMGTGSIQRLKLTADNFLFALYDTNGAHTAESGEESSPQEASPLKQTAARKRIVAEQRLMHLHHLVSETEEEFVVVDRTNGEIERVIGADNPQIVEQDGRKIALFTLLEFDKFGKGKYTGRLVQIQYELPAVPSDPSAPLEIDFPERVVVRTRDDLTKRGVWEEAEYRVYRNASEGLLLVHPANPAKHFELGFETERGREGWPRIRSVRGFEGGLERFYTPPHWSLVYPVERVRAEGTMGIGRVEDVTGEYEGRNLPDGHQVHRYHFSVHDGSLQKVTRLDVEIDADGKIVAVHPDRWEVDGVELDPELIRAETADAQTIDRLSAKLPSEEFLAATPLPDGQVRIFLLHRARGFKEAVGNTHYLAVDLQPDPETGNFLGRNVKVTRATFRHEPRDPAQFFAPSRLINNFSYTRRTGRDAVPHPYGFMMIEPAQPVEPQGEGDARLNFLFYDGTAHSRRKVEVTLQKGADGFFTGVEPGSLNVINYNDGTEIVSTADAQLTSEREGELVKYVLDNPQIKLHFTLNADGTFPADLNGRSFVIKERSTPEKLAAVRTKQEEERKKGESVRAILDGWREFVRKVGAIHLQQFDEHPVSKTGLGLAVKYCLPVYASLSEYPDEEIPEMIRKLLPLVFLLNDLKEGKISGEEAFARLAPEEAEKLRANKEAWDRAQGDKNSDVSFLPEERTMKCVSVDSAGVLAEYLVGLSLASQVGWMRKEWDNLVYALEQFFEPAILTNHNRVKAYGGFIFSLYDALNEKREVDVKLMVRILIDPRGSSWRENEFLGSLVTRHGLHKSHHQIQDWFARFGMTDPLAEVSRKRVRAVEEPADEPVDEAADPGTTLRMPEKGTTHLGIPPGRSPTGGPSRAGGRVRDPDKASRSGGKVGKGKGISEPKGPGSTKALGVGFEVYSGVDVRQEQAGRIMVESGFVEYLDDGGKAVEAEAGVDEAADTIEEADSNLATEADQVGEGSSSAFGPVSGICGGALAAGGPAFSNVIRLSRGIIR